MRALDALAGTLKANEDEETHESGKPDEKKKRSKSTGRRDLRSLPLEEERIEISDPLYEELLAEGKAERIGFEESAKLSYKRGGPRRVVVAPGEVPADDNVGRDLGGHRADAARAHVEVPWRAGAKRRASLCRGIRRAYGLDERVYCVAIFSPW